MRKHAGGYGRIGLFIGALLFALSALADSSPLNRLEVVTSAEPKRPFDLSRLRGRATVLYLWGDWCRACARSTPEVLTLVERHPEINFVFINTDDPERSVKSPARTNLLDTRVDRTFFGDTVMRKKGFRFSELGLVFGIPAYFVLDAQGRVIDSGNGSRYPTALETLLPSLSPPSAKG